MSETIAELRHKADKAQFGFWLYILTDIMLFASFFATYVILRGGTNGGPTSKELFDPSYALVETIILLISSLTCGLSYIAARQGNVRQALILLGSTIVLGTAFLVLELHEFGGFISQGHSWTESAFLSGFFALVGLHGLHIFTGLVWAIGLGGYLQTRGAGPNALRRYGLFTIFWHFLDIVWIFIFTIVYLMGVVS